MGWKRDLTRECVEPNPGPSVLDVLELFAKLACVSSSDPRILQLFDYIKSKVSFAAKINIITEEDIEKIKGETDRWRVGKG